MRGRGDAKKNNRFQQLHADATATKTAQFHTPGCDEAATFHVSLTLTVDQRSCGGQLNWMPAKLELEDRFTAKLEDCFTTKLEDRFTARLEDCFTAKLVDRFTAKLVDGFTAKLVDRFTANSRTASPLNSRIVSPLNS